MYSCIKKALKAKHGWKLKISMRTSQKEAIESMYANCADKTT